VSRAARIQKDMPSWQPKPQPWLRDKGHLSFIRQMPCLSCGRIGVSVPAHIRIQTDAAGARKPSDFYVVPLCGMPRIFNGCHEKQHKAERTFWADFMERGGPDPWSTAQALYRVSGDIEAGERIIFRARQMLRAA